MQRHHTIFIPARKHSLIRPYLRAPRFCAEKLEIPLPIVVNDVMTRLFSFTAAEYPAMTEEPKLLMMPWIKMFPTEIKLCCKMLGMATSMIFFKSAHSKSGGFFWTWIFPNLIHIVRTARIQLIPWHKKVAHATPATPMRKAFTNRISTRIFDVEDAARK